MYLPFSITDLNQFLHSVKSSRYFHCHPLNSYHGRPVDLRHRLINCVIGTFLCSRSGDTLIINAASDINVSLSNRLSIMFSHCDVARAGVVYFRKVNWTESISHDLSHTLYINSIVAKAHQCANLILRSFTSNGVSLMVRAYTVYVRPLLEHNNVIWSPHLK